MATETDLNEYVVVADMVNVSTGRMRKDNEPEVARMERGASIFSPASNESIQDLLSMGGIVLKSDLKPAMAALNKKRTSYDPQEGLSGGYPTVDRAAPDSGLRDTTREFRITAAGTAILMLNGEQPETVLDEIVPTHAPNPDLGVPGADVEV